MAHAISEFLEFLRAGEARPETINLRRRQLSAAERAIHKPLAEATEADLIGWLAHPSWSRETRRAARSALVTFFRWLCESGARADNPAARLPRVRAQEPLPRPAPEEALAAAFARADERETLMLRLAAECGLRRGEIALVHANDVFDGLDGPVLLVHGKGGRERLLPLSESLARALRRRTRQTGGWAFPGGVNGHLGAIRVGELLSAVLPGPVTAHALRHRFATRAYARSGDLLAVQQLLGHASPATTQRYVQLGVGRLREVAAAAAEEFGDAGLGHAEGVRELGRRYA